MITKEQAYKKALDIKKKILQEKTLRYNTLLNAAYASNPALTEIDFALSKIGADTAITAMSGNNDAVNNLKEKANLLTAEKNAILKKCKIEKPDYDCALCEDTGYINGKICSCVKEIAKSIITTDLCSAMPMNECTFDNFQLKYYADADSEKRMRSILNVCKEYAENFNPESSSNLLFMGASGLGKTHLSLAIAGEIIKKGYLPVYGPAENLFNEIEKERFSSYRNESDSYNTMISCDLLIIDDLGSEFITTFSKSILYNLINSRILSRKPTIISTNLNMKELEKSYSARITSRLIGNYDARLFLGKDIRQQKVMEGQI